MKVLLAEDSPTMRRLLASQLQGWDYEVTEAQDGVEAWEKFQHGNYPLVLTDWVMPNLDGLGLIRRIRELEHHEYVYIILLTARSQNEDLVEAMEAGADDFLGKPCNPRELRVRLLAGERIMDLEHTLIDQNHRLMKAQVALVQSEKLAGVGQLAAGMAHEINNPISFITNNLTVLQRDVQSMVELMDHYRLCLPLVEKVDKRLVDRIERVESECDLPWLKTHLPRLLQSSREGLSRVRDIVSNLRDFAHLNEAEIDDMGIADALESTLEILGPDLQAEQLTVEKRFDCRPSVPCQPAKIKQVFHSILLNAVQASHRGGTIGVAVSQDHASVCIEIKDHGHGMDETTQKRLFEPFYTTRPVGAGRGLGLAVSYGVIQQHQGSIDFESTLGKGTRFRVILPKAPESL